MKTVYKKLLELILLISYWGWHGVVALLISLVWMLLPWEAQVAYSGSLFYLSREIRDVEKLHNWDMKGFDYKGFFFPVAVSVVFHLVLLFIKNL